MERCQLGRRDVRQRGCCLGALSLFFWAEFMAEKPVKPKGRCRKPQPATLSMFEWALTLEQEREAEPVGSGG